MYVVQRPSFPLRQCIVGFALAASGLVLGSHAVAADKNKSTYERDRAACMDGSSQQERTACLREAAAARGEARKGNLTEQPSYTENATRRCQGLPAADRDDCVRRVEGAGTTSGSVGGGGVYRETRTTVVGQPAPSAPMYAPAAPAPVPEGRQPNPNAQPEPMTIPAAPMYAPMPAPVPAR